MSGTDPEAFVGAHGNYLIFYRVGAETVEILHILYGAMNLGADLFLDN